MIAETEKSIWQRIAAWYTAAMTVLGCSLLAGIVIIMGVQVFFRYVLNDSIIWAEEMCRYLLVWITFLFLGLAYQKGEMISLSILMSRVSRSVQIALTVFAHVTSIVFLGFIVWYGFLFAEGNALQTLPAFDFIGAAFLGSGQTLDVSSFWLYGSIPVGATILAIHLAVTLVIRVKQLLAGEKIYDDFVEGDSPGLETR